MIIMKGRQVEMSEFSMNWLLNKLDRHPYTAGLHAFPREKQCLRFSKQRLDSAIKDSVYIRDWYSDRESELLMRKFIKKPEDGQKNGAYNFYFLVHTWESKKDTVGDAARNITLDFIVYDERQDHPNDVETVLGEGASHSEFKQTLTLGTPKLPGIQFDQQWEASDKRYWFVTCSRCGRQSIITMDNILDSGDDELGYYYGCTHCKEPLDRNMGLWQATNPQRRPLYRGYHINQLMVCWITANEIMKKKNSPNYSKRRFHNEVLGEAYGGDDIPMTWTAMMNCTKNTYKLGQVDNNKLYGGVDWGNTSYCVVQTKTSVGHRLIDIIIASDSDPREHPKTIARGLKKYKGYIKRVVADAGPDISRTNNLRDELKSEGICNDVWACYYLTPPAKTDTAWNNKEGYVSVGRSEMIDNIIDEVLDEYFIIPGEDKNIDRVDDLMEHFTNIVAEKVENTAGNAFVLYVNTGPDHLLHAKLYSDVASLGETGSPIAAAAKPFVPRREIVMASKGGLIVPKPSQTSSKFPIFGRNRRRR